MDSDILDLVLSRTKRQKSKIASHNWCREELSYVFESFKEDFLFAFIDDIALLKWDEFLKKVASKKVNFFHNPIALRKAKIACNFGLSECNRVKELTFIGKSSKNKNDRVVFPEGVIIHLETLLCSHV